MSSTPAAAPVLALYRAILRVHRAKLPPMVQEMGNKYVREEFASHLRGNTNDSQWKMFMGEWHNYKDMLSAHPAERDDGEDSSVLATGVDRAGDLSEEVLSQLSPDQIERLQKMRHEAVKFGQALTEDKKAKTT